MITFDFGDIEWEVPEFDLRDSLTICREILSLKERQGIAGAATSAEEGNHEQAARWRDFAGYAGLNK